MSKLKFSVLIVTVAVYLQPINLVAQNLVARIDSIQIEIEKIRGAKFKHVVKVANQSLEDFGKYIDKMLDKQFSESHGKNYGKVVKKLGLYRGPDIKDFKQNNRHRLQLRSAQAAHLKSTWSQGSMPTQRAPIRPVGAQRTRVGCQLM